MPGSKRIIGIILCFFMLGVIYIFQQFNYLNFFLSLFGTHADNPNTVFIFNKTLRLILNDSVCLVLIYLIFQEKSYVRVGLWLQAIEVVIILPLYFWVKLSTEGDSEISSPMLSQLHRLIINPTLMILLIVAFFYQRISRPSAR